jgi:diguanylate cyclase (GGDEF)-like protein/PAS domain S-box-containing protein
MNVLRRLWPLLASNLLMLGIAAFCMATLSSMRAYVGGESLWSKAQKDAVTHLRQFARNGDLGEFRKFRAALEIPMGDRVARIEMQKPRPNLSIAYTGLLAGGNHPDDIPGMIRLFRMAGQVPYMKRAVQIWTQGDGLIDQLDETADQLLDEVTATRLDRSGRTALLEQVDRLDFALRPLEDEFGATLGIASRITTLTLQWSAALSAALFLAFGVILSRSIMLRSESTEKALRSSERRALAEQQRAQVTLASIHDGVLTTDAEGRIDFLNAVASDITGWSLQEAKGRPLTEVFQLVHEGKAEPVAAALAELRAGTDITDRLQSATLINRANQPIPVDCSLALIRDGDTVSGIVAVARDISARRTVERALQRQTLQHGLLARFGQVALENPPFGDLMTQAAEIVQQGLSVDLCRVLKVGLDDRTLIHVAGAGWSDSWLREPFFDAAAETEGHFVVGAREAIVVHDFESEARFRYSPILRAHAVRAAVEVLICGAGGPHGVLGAYAREPGRFDDDSVNFVRSVSNTLAAAIVRRNAEEQLAYMAQFDALTGLPNRSLYLDRLGQTLVEAERDKRPVGVLFVDIDRFKNVNDTHGHGVGDLLLVKVAERLRAAVRSGDTVGRLGGDEFTVTLAHLARDDDAGKVARKIVSALGESFELGGHRVYVSASIGISVYPVDGREPDTLLKNADTAMYRAKESGRSMYQFYLPQMNERAVARMRIESDLRGALGRGEFLLHYQPKVELVNGEISGVEALLRWSPPGRDLVSPDQFISILEDTGLIVPIGKWVVTTVCAQIRRWQAEGVTPRPVAVNLSARQFRQADLDAVIGDILSGSAVDPGLLELELTESTLMSDSEATVQTLRSMKARGIRVAVDDFGTGYSSLGYLKRFPIDALKIDRTFIRDVTTDPDDATIVLAIINLARSLKLKVVAEGVETEEQLTFLRAHGCDELQGYYFAQPLPVEQITCALLENRRLELPAACRTVDNPSRWANTLLPAGI